MLCYVVFLSVLYAHKFSESLLKNICITSLKVSHVTNYQPERVRVRQGAIDPQIQLQLEPEPETEPNTRGAKEGDEHVNIFPHRYIVVDSQRIFLTLFPEWSGVEKHFVFFGMSFLFPSI